MIGSIPNLLPGVPHVESPFFADHFPPAADPFLRQVAASLRHDGCAVIDFPDEAIGAVARDLFERLRGPRRRPPPPPLKDAWRTDEDVRRIATNVPVIDLLGALYGRRAFPFETVGVPSRAGQRIHSDAILFSSVPERFMCSVWLALEDMHDDGGGLVYYPGSHRWPIYVNEHIGHIHDPLRGSAAELYEPLWRRLVEVHRAEPRRLLLRKGQTLLCAANLLYGEEEPRDPSRTGWCQLTRYLFEDCCYYTPMLSDPGFGSTAFRTPVNILTGKPQANVYGGAPIDPAYMVSVEPRRGAPIPPEEFDPESYLRANPDVATSILRAREHYITFGIFEGRRVSPP